MALMELPAVPRDNLIFIHKVKDQHTYGDRSFGGPFSDFYHLRRHFLLNDNMLFGMGGTFFVCTIDDCSTKLIDVRLIVVVQLLLFSLLRHSFS